MVGLYAAVEIFSNGYQTVTPGDEFGAYTRPANEHVTELNRC